MRIRAAVLLLALLLSACSGGVVPPLLNADHYMREGDAFFADERYEDAIASWEKVRERYVSPEVNAQAELKIANAQFQAEKYVEASVAYEAFLKQYPEHPTLADVLYRLGVSYFKEILAPERDQTITVNALSVLETLLKRFPEDLRRSEVEPMMRECRARLAGHELHIGTFYLRKEHYAAAIGRLEPIIAQYPDFTALDQVYFGLGTAYLRSGNRSSAAEYFNRLSAEYPESKLIAKAQKLLEREY